MSLSNKVNDLFFFLEDTKIRLEPPTLLVTTKHQFSALLFEQDLLMQIACEAMFNENNIIKLRQSSK